MRWEQAVCPLFPWDGSLRALQPSERMSGEGSSEGGGGGGGGGGVGDSEESQSLYRLLHHLIRTGQVRIEGDADDDDADSSDDDQQITLKVA